MPIVAIKRKSDYKELRLRMPVKKYENPGVEKTLYAATISKHQLQRIKKFLRDVNPLSYDAWIIYNKGAVYDFLLVEPDMQILFD